MRPTAMVPLVLLASLASLAALPAGEPAIAEEVGDRFVVPLSQPGRPVTLRASLVQGGITVVGYGGQEVVVETMVAGQGRHRKAPPEAQGMRRIPNRSLGVVVEEESNEVVIRASGATSADLRIQVPVETSLKLTAVNNGDILVRGVRGDLELRNTNGEIQAHDVSGSVVAHTVNGDVVVTLRRVEPGAAMSFTTLNGDVDVTLPAGITADLKMRSDRGEIYTAFDVALRPSRLGVSEEREGGRYRVKVEQEMEGTINGGGPLYQLRTVNGDIFIRKGGG
ncbi:MAG TPA: DUF4097 family beta strand repeat-containing protein [Thermoanaerobaculia bacterium]|nr:DUF4097 family beta strand repeat-containing protein [Thermoanaerobaculia bacterium]